MIFSVSHSLVPMKLLFDSRSRMTVYPLPGLISVNLWEILPQVDSPAQNPGSAKLVVFAGM